MPLSPEQFALLDHSWNLVRNSVAKEMFDSALVPVPSFSDAGHFGLFSVFVKGKSGKGLKHLMVPTYHVLGHLSQVIQLDRTDLGRLLNSAQPHNEDIDSSKTWESDSAFDDKSVHMVIEGLSKTLIPLNMEEGDLFLNTNIPYLTGAKSIYIVTDVMKANHVTAVVTGDDDSWERISMGPCPIGFGYSKFRLTPDGVVAEQKKSKPSFNGKWDVVSDQISAFLNDLSDG